MHIKLKTFVKAIFSYSAVIVFSPQTEIINPVKAVGSNFQSNNNRLLIKFVDYVITIFMNKFYQSTVYILSGLNWHWEKKSEPN